MAINPQVQSFGTGGFPSVSHGCLKWNSWFDFKYYLIKKNETRERTCLYNLIFLQYEGIIQDDLKTTEMEEVNFA